MQIFDIIMSGMKRTLILILVLLLAAAARAQTVTIASYNIENAFDVFDDPYTSDEGTDVKQRWEWQAIAGTIGELNADVVAFCEVENEHVLRAMVSEFLPGAGYDYIVCGQSNTDRGINLGFISRLPISSVTSYRHRTLTLPGEDRTWKFARDLFRVTLDAPDGRPLDVFVVHFKSRSNSSGDPNSRKWRLAEATMSKRILDGILLADPGARLAIVGDFNDTPGDPAIGELLAGGTLHDAHAHLPADGRVTYLKEPYRSTIDYILVSPALFKGLVPDKTRVLHDETLLKGSDHAPIVATFDLGKQ